MIVQQVNWGLINDYIETSDPRLLDSWLVKLIDNFRATTGRNDPFLDMFVFHVNKQGRYQYLSCKDVKTDPSKIIDVDEEYDEYDYTIEFCWNSEQDKSMFLLKYA